MEVELNGLKRLLVGPQKKAQILQIEAEAGIRENQLLHPSGVRILIEDNHIVVNTAHTDEIVTTLVVLVANNLRTSHPQAAIGHRRAPRVRGAQKMGACENTRTHTLTNAPIAACERVVRTAPGNSAS